MIMLIHELWKINIDITDVIILRAVPTCAIRVGRGTDPAAPILYLLHNQRTGQATVGLGRVSPSHELCIGDLIWVAGCPFGYLACARTSVASSSSVLLYADSHVHCRHPLRHHDPRRHCLHRPSPRIAHPGEGPIIAHTCMMRGRV